MGNAIPSLDMMMNDLLRPLMNAYSFQQYESTAKMLFTLNNYLIGLRTGIDDMKRPELPDTTATTMTNRTQYFSTYCDFYMPLVVLSLGNAHRKFMDTFIAERNSIM